MTKTFMKGYYEVGMTCEIQNLSGGQHSVYRQSPKNSSNKPDRTSEKIDFEGKFTYARF